MIAAVQRSIAAVSIHRLRSVLIIVKPSRRRANKGFTAMKRLFACPHNRYHCIAARTLTVCRRCKPGSYIEDEKPLPGMQGISSFRCAVSLDRRGRRAWRRAGRPIPGAAQAERRPPWLHPGPPTYPDMLLGRPPVAADLRPRSLPLPQAAGSKPLAHCRARGVEMLALHGPAHAGAGQARAPVPPAGSDGRQGRPARRRRRRHRRLHRE